VDKNRRGAGFLIFADKSLEDLYLPPQEAEFLFPGDRVEVRLARSGALLGLRVLEHRFRELIGRFRSNPQRNLPNSGWVVYQSKKLREEIFSPEGGIKAKEGDWVFAKLEFHQAGAYSVTAEILEAYGPELPPSADIKMVSGEFNLLEEHHPQAIKEAKSFTLEVPGKDLDERMDLRDVPFITIDGETARDFDDAVYVEQNPQGYNLWVAIADVSHYVKDGTTLNKDAFERATSVYFPERAFHMLPRELSENLCSLRPNEPRLALVAKMKFSKAGSLRATEVFEAVIESKRRATYTEIQLEYEDNKNNKDWIYAPHFELFKVLRKKRIQRGSVDFDLPEPYVLVDETGDPLSITIAGRKDAHRLIEEFMIAANESVTEWMMERHWPFVYRVHEEPSEQALQRFQDLAETVGVKISIKDAADDPSVLSKVLEKIAENPAAFLLNMTLLRSMKQAVYTSVHGIHYGLASEGYTHFTSPIRRYPDLIVHRMIRRAIRAGGGKFELNDEERSHIEKELDEICEHCNYRERLAAEAERESIRFKQVRLMRKHLGQEFPAKVVGMNDKGIFVQISDPYVEGLVSRDAMIDDYYVYNEDKMVFFGQKKRRTFKIGTAVTVIAVRANLDERKIDFVLKEHFKNLDETSAQPTHKTIGKKIGKKIHKRKR
jgi:ribonuclease R